MPFSPRQKKFLLSVLASAIAAGTLCAAPAPKKKKITEPTSTLEGYFVRVKSGVSGEKELYYDKDGTLRKTLGDGLLGGEFSLDESLLSGSDGLDLDFAPGTPPPPPSAAPPPPAKAEGEIPSPAVPAAPAAEAPAETPRAAAFAREEKSAAASEDDGVVDDEALLKKFSSRKAPDAFGVSSENFRKVLNAEADDRFFEPFSLREWQGSTAFGMRRFSSDADAFEMRSAERADDGNFEAGLFETRSALAGERMFVRDGDGLFEVRLNERFSAAERTFANGLARPLRETSGFSMQDINRYQFRRNRSSDPGLPVVSPDSGGNARRENFGGRGNAGFEQE